MGESKKSGLRNWAGTWFCWHTTDRLLWDIPIWKNNSVTIDLQGSTDKLTKFRVHSVWNQHWSMLRWLVRADCALPEPTESRRLRSHSLDLHPSDKNTNKVYYFKVAPSYPNSMLLTIALSSSGRSLHFHEEESFCMDCGNVHDNLRWYWKNGFRYLSQNLISSFSNCCKERAFVGRSECRTTKVETRDGASE